MAAVNAVADQIAAMKKLDAMRVVSSPPPNKVASSPAPGPKASAAGPVQTPLKRVTADGDWICRACTKRNDAETDGDCTCPSYFKFCPKCGESAAGVAHRQAPPTVSKAWDCHCGESCPESFHFCVECGLPAGAPKPPAPGGCGGCDEAMPESWMFCPDCGTEAGEWDSGAMERAASAPLGSGKDWPCAKCNTDIPGGFRFCPECGSMRKAA